MLRTNALCWPLTNTTDVMLCMCTGTRAHTLHTLHTHQKKTFLKLEFSGSLKYMWGCAFYVHSHTEVGTGVWNTVLSLCQVSLCGTLNPASPVGQLPLKGCSGGLDLHEVWLHVGADLCHFISLRVIFPAHIGVGLTSSQEVWDCASLMPLCHVLRFSS